VFCCDCTSSMSSYIESAKQNIRKISEKLCSMEAKNMRYGLVCYRDHPPQDSSYATKVFPLTPSISKMQGYVDTMTAEGGGDGPESVACALHEALNSDWRKDAVKVCVVIADAPPHGLGESGDGFPGGCPCGKDPLAIARKMAEQKIIIYSVAVEPNLGGYKNGRAFFKGISQTTHGRYLGLGQAQLLPDVIIGGSAEELDLKKVENDIETEVVKVKSETPSLAGAELEAAVYKNIASKGVKTWHLDVTHQDALIPNESIYMASESLATAQQELDKITATASSLSYASEAIASPVSYSAPSSSSSSPFSAVSNFFSGVFGSSSSSTADVASSPLYSPSAPSSASPMFAPSYSSAPKEYSSQSANVYQDSISQEQVARVMHKNKW